MLNIFAGLFLILSIVSFVNRNRFKENACMSAVYRGKTYYRVYSIKIADIFDIYKDDKNKYKIKCRVQECKEDIELNIDDKCANYIKGCKSDVPTNLEPFCGINIFYMETEQGIWIKACPYKIAFIPQDMKPIRMQSSISYKRAIKIIPKIHKDMRIVAIAIVLSAILMFSFKQISIIISIFAFYMLLGTRDFSVLQKSKEWCIIKVQSISKNTDGTQVGLPNGFADWTKEGKYIYSLYSKYRISYNTSEDMEQYIEPEATNADAKQNSEMNTRPIENSTETAESGFSTENHGQDEESQKTTTNSESLPTKSETVQDIEIEEEPKTSITSQQELPTPVSALESGIKPREESLGIDVEELKDINDLDASREEFDKEMSGEESFDPSNFEFSPNETFDSVQESTLEPDDVSLAGEGMVEISDETPPSENDINAPTKLELETEKLTNDIAGEKDDENSNTSISKINKFGACVKETQNNDNVKLESLKNNFPHTGQSRGGRKRRPRHGSVSPQKQWKQWD